MLSKNMKKIRTQKKLTRRKLSEMAQVTERSICNIEFNRSKSPRLDTVQRLSEALGVSIEELIK